MYKYIAYTLYNLASVIRYPKIKLKLQILNYMWWNPQLMFLSLNVLCCLTFRFNDLISIISLLYSNHLNFLRSVLKLTAPKTNLT
jgi:hypothetical protein